MTAKESLLKHIQDNKVDYVQINCIDHDYGSELTIQGTLDEVLHLLDFEYDRYDIRGTIWYTDGSWSVSSEYNNTFYWEHIVRPIMPDKNSQYKVSLKAIRSHADNNSNILTSDLSERLERQSLYNYWVKLSSI